MRFGVSGTLFDAALRRMLLFLAMIFLSLVLYARTILVPVGGLNAVVH